MTYYAHPTALIDPSASIGVGTKIWHFCHIMAGSSMGENCTLGQNVVISPHVHLGNGVKIQNNVSVYTGVSCEDDVFLGPSCVFTNVINPRSFISRKEEFRPTLVRQGATIGANATIVCGTQIGRYALIGAGSVVTKDVKDYELVYGNPASHRGWVSKHGHKLAFDAQGVARCPESHERYILENGSVRSEDNM